jgi:nitrate reductase delta subunit
MLGTFTKSREHIHALDQIEAWTRARFALAPDETVLVAEVACTLPGCPPLETVVAFWTADKTRHHFKIFKRVDQVVEGDLPYAWLKNALAVAEGFDPSCC